MLLPGDRHFPSIPVLRTRGGQTGPPRPCPVLSEAWKKNLKDLASRVANFAKETEARANEAGPAAEQRSEPGKKAFVSPSKALLLAREGALLREDGDF